MSALFVNEGLPCSPAPVIDPETRPYWDGAARGQLVLPFCQDCDAFFWYPRGFCSRCSGSNLTWVNSEGAGRVYSFTVVHKAFGEWRNHVPFVVAWITLDEGISVTGNIIGIDPEQVAVDLPVRAVFQLGEGSSPAILRFVTS